MSKYTILVMKTKSEVVMVEVTAVNKTYTTKISAITDITIATHMLVGRKETSVPAILTSGPLKANWQYKEYDCYAATFMDKIKEDDKGAYIAINCKIFKPNTKTPIEVLEALDEAICNLTYHEDNWIADILDSLREFNDYKTDREDFDDEGAKNLASLADIFNGVEQETINTKQVWQVKITHTNECDQDYKADILYHEDIKKLKNMVKGFTNKLRKSGRKVNRLPKGAYTQTWIAK